MDPFKKPSGTTGVIFAPLRKPVQTEIAPKVISRIQEINNNPKDYVYISGKNFSGTVLESEPVKYLLFADISGSNDGAAAGLIEYYKIFATSLPNGFFRPFGPQVGQNHALLAYSGLSISSTPWDDIKASQFNSGTYSNLIIQGIRAQQSPFILLIQSDGEISDFPTFCGFLRSGEGVSKMELCRGMYVLFSNHTTAITKSSVERQLIEILGTSLNNAIPFEFVLDRKTREIVPNVLATIGGWQSNSCYKIPEEHLVWDDLIFSKNITKFQLAKLFWHMKELHPYVSNFTKQIKNLLSVNPEKATMLRDNLAYARIYGTLMTFWGITKDSCSLFEELVELKKKVQTVGEKEPWEFVKNVENSRVTVAQLHASSKTTTDLPLVKMIEILQPVKTNSDLITGMKNFLSDVKSKAKGELVGILDDLLNGAREDDAEVSLSLDKIVEDMVGYIQLVGVTRAEILDAVKDSSGTVLHSWITNNFQKIQFVSGRNLPKGAIPIAIPSADVKTHRLSLSLIFNQFSLKLNERQTYVLAMILILTNGIPGMLKRIAENAILDDGKYTVRQMGLKGVFEIDPMFLAVKVSKMVNMMFTLYGDRMFKDVEENIREMLSYTFSLFDVAYFLRDLTTKEPFVNVMRIVPFVPTAESGTLIPIIKPMESNAERAKFLNDVSYAGHPKERANTFITEAEHGLITRLSTRGISALTVMLFDFGGFYAYSHKPLRTNFLRQLRQIIKRSWIEGCDQSYYLSVKNKWKALGYADIPIVENESEALELLAKYAGSAGKIVHFVEEEVEIPIPIKEVLKRQAFQSRFPYSSKFWELVISSNNPSYALFVELIRENSIERLNPSDFPKYTIRTHNNRAIYNGEFSLTTTDDELDLFYSRLLCLAIERRKAQTIPKSSQESFGPGEQAFDVDFGIEYCPCCFVGLRPKTGSELSCGHIICQECTIRMAEYKPGDFVELWKHQCPLCRTQIPFVPGRFGSQLANSKLKKNVIYRFCELGDCAQLFDAGERTCIYNIDQFPARCELHRVKNRFNCPNCNQSLEYAGGCRLFRCCVFGYHGCGHDNGRKCTHGGLCGHQWQIEQEQGTL